MTKTNSFEKIRERIDKIPVIDCHEHTVGPSEYPKQREPIASIISGYFTSDLMSAGAEPEIAMLGDNNIPTEKKWAVFERTWKKTQHTGYAHVAKWILKNIYGIEKFNLENIKAISGKTLDLSDEKAYFGFLEKHGIKCRLVNIWIDWKKFLDGNHKLPHCDRLLISLPDYHAVRSYDSVFAVTQRIGRTVVSLDEYLDVCRQQFKRFVQLGAVGMKDQSAYGRGIAYDNPSRGEAEILFNKMMEDPRKSLGWPKAKPLDDYLFHQFMIMARDLNLPVQIHTGHMAGIRNDIAKTNAVLFTKALELHREVKFDLFHGNWPYAGEWLYLGKNFPNVSLDCCWLHIIDPRYAVRVLADSLVTVPHGKIHGFGGDYGDNIEASAGHLAIARDNIALALAEMVDIGWIGIDEAVQVAADWLFNNPNEFFKLGYNPVVL